MYECVEALGEKSEDIKGVRIPRRKQHCGLGNSKWEMTIAEAGDSRHYSLLEKNFKIKSRLILCFPLKLEGQEVYGAVQVIDTSAAGEQLTLTLPT